ncbi:hypothetical protein PIROE2DRAFT_57225 [Piromyces sp. E2]|nr:hypothetical protein PIROE2DRAFT_57225 [Piromyces sp. E2]|eukprot:OUM69663.1 hypothetical protein PIROE2DRAFT_57225 [Piromyces sp. E2]
MSENKLNENNDHEITNHQDLDVSIIPISDVKNYSKENNLNECTQYDSGELADYSNFSLTTNTTTDSSGSNLCMHQNKVSPLDDPIIQEMFKQRTVEMDKIEEERRIRMYTMMRYSKKYKHLQTERANMKWDQQNYENTERSLKNMNSQLGIPDSEGNSLEDHGKLSNWFSDDSPPKMQRSISVKHSQSNFGIDLHDLDQIDMELNNCQSNCSENSNDENDEEEKSVDNKHNDIEHEEINLNGDVKVYSNNQDQNYDEITKSNSKISTSSSENENNNNELIESHYKFNSRMISNRSLSKMKSQSLCITDDEQLKINNYLSNSDLNTDSNTLSNSISNSLLYSSNDFTNSDNNIRLYPHKDSQLVINTKEKKKHKKLKLFKLGHKNKNTIEINDTNTLNKVVFNSKNSIDNNSDETYNPSLSVLEFTHEVNSFNKSNDKKKKHAFIRFFLGKKFSKSDENEDKNINNITELNEPHIERLCSALRVPNSEKCFKKVKSLRFSDSVSIIP